MSMLAGFGSLLYHEPSLLSTARQTCHSSSEITPRSNLFFKVRSTDMQTKIGACFVLNSVLGIAPSPRLQYSLYKLHNCYVSNTIFTFEYIETENHDNVSAGYL